MCCYSFFYRSHYIAELKDQHPDHLYIHSQWAFLVVLSMERASDDFSSIQTSLATHPPSRLPCPIPDWIVLCPSLQTEDMPLVGKQGPENVSGLYIVNVLFALVRTWQVIIISIIIRPSLRRLLWRGMNYKGLVSQLTQPTLHQRAILDLAPVHWSHSPCMCTKTTIAQKQLYHRYITIAT